MAKKDENNKPQKERSDISLGDVIETGKTKKMKFKNMVNPKKYVFVIIILRFHPQK